MAFPADVVELQLTVSRWGALQSTTQTFSLDGFLDAWWYDPRLKHNASDMGCGARRLLLTPEEVRQVWRPEFFWYSAAGNKVTLPGTAGVGESAGQMFEASPDGRVHFSQQISFEMACQMDLTLMPYDRQTCSFATGLYSTPASEVLLAWRADVSAIIDFTFGSSPAGWYPPSSTTTTAFQTPYMTPSGGRDFPGMFPFAASEWVFYRNPTPLMYAYFVPAVMSVMMASLGFFIKADAMPARAALGIVSMLIGLTNMVALNQALPPGLGAGSKLPWILDFQIVSFWFTAAAMSILVFASFGQESLSWSQQEEQLLKGAAKSWQTILISKPTQLKALLQEWDEDGSQSVTKKEFRRCIAGLGINATAAEINEFFDKLDKDNSGQLEFAELETLFAEEKQRSRRGDRSEHCLLYTSPSPRDS